MSRTRPLLSLLFLFASLASLPAPAHAGDDPVLEVIWGGSPGAGSWRFSGIRGIVTTSQQILVCDAQNNRIQRLDREGRFLGAFGHWGSEPGAFLEPGAVALDRSDNLHVADFGDGRVEVFTQTGGFLREFGSPGLEPGQLQRPTALAVDRQGNVYVADEGDRIQKFDAFGAFVAQWGTSGTGAGQLSRVSSLAIGRDNTLLVADAGDRVQEFGLDGGYRGGWGGPGSGPGQFHGPLGLAVTPGGDVLVADSGNYRVQRFTAEGVFIAAFGSQGSGQGEFDAPVVVAADGPDHILVGESYNSRVQGFCVGADCQPFIPPPTLVDSPKILLHVVAAPREQPCAIENLADCRGAVPHAGLSGPEGPFFYVYLMVGNTRPDQVRIAGVECGINYQLGQPGDMRDGKGLDILGWTLCATLEFPTPGEHEWPRPGGGNLVTWTESGCPRDLRPRVAGYFYVAAYAADRLLITPRPASGLAATASCTGKQSDLEAGSLGYAAFSAGASDPGCNPCTDDDCATGALIYAPLVPVQPASWSSIKALYARP